MKRDRQSRARDTAARGFLVRLCRDARGGAAVMLAMMVVPLLLFVGSAVDVTRVYTVKARLQQACDAGVLAGRRSMTDASTTGPTATTLDATATAQANAFFKNNFHVPTSTSSGWMQTTVVTAGQAVFVPSKVLTPEAQVSGTASVKVPMAIMKMFGFQPITLTATCEARYDTADADIMFVLDQTGSMACLTSDDNDTTCKTYVSQNVVANGNAYSITEKSGSRISGLRTEVLNFFDTVTSQAAASTTNFRFGFVPYNSAANVGKLLMPFGYVRTSADYQSRISVDSNSGSPTVTSPNSTAAACPTGGPTRSPVAGQYNKDASNNYYANVTTVTYGGGKCTTSVQKVVPSGQWTYQQLVSVDTSGYIAQPSSAVATPSQYDGSTSTWAGCVEERVDPSSRSQTSFNLSSPPLDLDPDTAPTSASTKWAPWWPETTFARYTTATETNNESRTFYSRIYNNSLNGSTPDFVGKAYNEVACPLAAIRLNNASTTLPAASSTSTKATIRSNIQTYLSAANGFKPYGTTYHDVGMTWGLRLISPTGMFANDTAAWSGHNAPNRYIIFLTDGDIETDPAGDGNVYSEFGMEEFEGRVGNGATGNTLDNYHNQRFLAECQLAKNRNIKIFVIGYAQALTTELRTCASPGQAYSASDQTGLNTAFTAIARQVALLRVSK